FRLALIFAVAAVLFYGNSEWVPRRWSDQFANAMDRVLLQRLSYVGCLMVLVGAWIAFPAAWTAVAWAIVALGLAFLARRFRRAALAYQAGASAAAAVVRAFGNNLDAGTPVLHVSSGC